MKVGFHLNTTVRESATCRRLPVSKGIRPGHKQHVGSLPDDVSRGLKLYKIAFIFLCDVSSSSYTRSARPIIKSDSTDIFRDFPTTVGAHRGAYAQGCFHLGGSTHRDRETRDRPAEEEPSQTNLHQQTDDPPTLEELNPTRVHCNLGLFNICIKICIKIMEKTRKKFKRATRNS